MIPGDFLMCMSGANIRNPITNRHITYTQQLHPCILIFPEPENETSAYRDRRYLCLSSQHGLFTVEPADLREMYKK